MLAQLAFFISTTIKENLIFMGKKNVEKHSDFMPIDYFINRCGSGMARSESRLESKAI